MTPAWSKVSPMESGTSLKFRIFTLMKRSLLHPGEEVQCLSQIEAEWVKGHRKSQPVRSVLEVDETHGGVASATIVPRNDSDGSLQHPTTQSLDAVDDGDVQEGLQVEGPGKRFADALKRQGGHPVDGQHVEVGLGGRLPVLVD